MKNRSRLDIIAEILKAATAGALKTRIMYSVALSFDQLNEYVSLLVDNGLLDYDAKKRVYKTTKNGHDFLTKYEKLRL
jgi:predicted transcriptional regulator